MNRKEIALLSAQAANLGYLGAKDLQAAYEAQWNRHCDELSECGADIAKELDIPERGAMGLVPDAIKSRPQYVLAWKRERHSFDLYREWNGVMNKLYKKEIRAANAQRYAERLAKVAA